MVVEVFIMVTAVLHGLNFPSSKNGLLTRAYVRVLGLVKLRFPIHQLSFAQSLNWGLAQDIGGVVLQAAHCVRYNNLDYKAWMHVRSLYGPGGRVNRAGHNVDSRLPDLVSYFRVNRQNGD